MSEYINIIWEIIELIAAVIECVMIAFFVIGMLGFKNVHLKNVKTIGFIAVSCINSILVSAYINVDSITSANQIIICTLFSLIFLRGSFLYKLFVSALSMFFILIINSVLLTLMSTLFKTPIYILISASSILRLAVLFLTKSIYFVVTKAVIKLSKSFTLRLSKAESIYTITFFFVTLIAGNILFDISASDKSPTQFSAMTFAALFLVNILNILLVRKIHETSVDSEDTIQRIIKQNETIKTFYQLYTGNEEISRIFDSQHNSIYSDTLNYIILDAQLKCRRKSIIFNYSISPYIREFPENDISGVVFNLLGESVSAYNRWEYKPSIDLEILCKNKYISIIVSHYIKGEDVDMLMEDKKCELVPFNPYRNKIISSVISRYNGFIFRSQKRDKIITNIWLDFSHKKLPR